MRATIAKHDRLRHSSDIQSWGLAYFSLNQMVVEWRRAWTLERAEKGVGSVDASASGLSKEKNKTRKKEKEIEDPHVANIPIWAL